MSDVNEGALGLEHCGIDGVWPEVFDVVHVELDQPRPSPWQPENWSLSGTQWELVDRLAPANAADLLDTLVNHGGGLFTQADRKVNAGYLRAHPIDASLTLVKPDTLEWNVEEPPWGGRQRKARFTLGQATQFDFAVTDIAVEQAVGSLGLGVHPRSAIGIDEAAEVYLTISLSEPYPRNDDCYKLVAAVITTG